ncbi:MAG: DUF4838 domain-containing protein, partial [Clostridia bacterium]|nr:DUF4838 domain-containing protein [Clostridia bacterium]
ATTLQAGAWTKFIISPEAIEHNKTYGVVCCVNQGASTAGWQMSPIYLGPEPVKAEIVYLDHADVKDVIALINALPETATLSDKTAVEAARAAYDNLTAEQQTLVDATKLVNAENTIGDIESANEVIALIDAINAYDVDESMVSEARTAYDGLTDGAKALVTNLSTLESYEAELAKASKVTEVIEMIAVLPDSVTMPAHLVYVPRIEAARDAYFALEAEDKEKVDNYTKLRSLIASIKGYTTVYRQSLDGASVIPSHVPNYTSTIGGSASIAEDSYYGNYLRVTPDAGGKAAVQFVNFPDVSQYSKLYFNVRVVGASCDIYLSDGTSNDGWGDNWKNTWSLSGFWANDGSWIQKEVEVSTGIFSSNWALGLRTETTDVYFEITDIVGWASELGTDSGLTFGTFEDSGTTNEYGTVYNFTQGWSSDTDMGVFNANALSGALATGHDSLHFWIYNPNDAAVDLKITGDMNEWTPQGDYVTNLPSKVWTEVVLTPEIVEQGNQGMWYVNVTTGAGTSGWQISPIYSFNSQSVSADAVADVQALIDALDSQSSSTEAVQAARLAYEALTEAEKKLVGVDNLISCEDQLWTDGEGTSGTPFIVDRASNYKIYYEAGLKEIATFMQKHIEEATGARLPLVSAKPETITQYRYAIVIGYNDLLNTNLGCDIPASGYVLRLIGRTVCIVADRSDNYRMGGLAFLSETIGYSMIAEDCVIYNPDTEIMTPVDEEAAPSFAYRQQQTYMTDDELLGMGLQSHTDLWIPSDHGWDMHNALHYLPVATYGTDHPNWYTSDQTQICPTAGGTATEFNAMVDVIVANMMTQINKYPEQENISFSIMDSAGDDACTCTRCTLYTTLYGEGGFSAAWIDLMNAINEKIQAQISESSERKLNVAFLAYRSTEKAPANDDLTLQYRYEINDDGSYTQTSEYLKCDDEVMVWLAPIDGKYAENFEHDDNAATLATIKKWRALSGNVFLWMYGANFKNYMYPYNTWQANAENYKILAKLGVKGVWSQSNETEGTAFSDLKAYIDSQFLCNVNVDYEGVLNNYFTNYFGEGAEKMRAMFDEIVKKCNEIEETYGLGRGIYDEIENTTGVFGVGAKTYWSQEWINSLVTLCDEAKAAVNADTTLTNEQKAVILNRITKESLFPRFVLCTSFASKYSNSEKTTLRQEFKADAEALGLTLYKEADGLLSDLYSDWDV